MNNIVLTGFRATGKTSVGKALATKLGYAFSDTDRLLCERLHAPIADIVARHGWPFFRQAEAQLLRELASMTHTVLATGGGAIQHHAEWSLLRTHSYVVWLDADLATISKRIAADAASAAQRPALVQGLAAHDEIETLLEQRRPLYAAGSDLRLDTANDDPETLAERIVEQLKRMANEGMGKTLRDRAKVAAKG